MDIPPVDIPLVRQEPESNDSLRCCAQMLFSYFKDDITKETIRKKIHLYKKHSGLDGSYLQDLGIFALKRGYKVTIKHYDWNLWNKDVYDAIKKSKKAVVKALVELKSENKNWAYNKILQKDVSFLKLDGDFIFENPKSNDIDRFLIQRTPVVISVRGRDFYKSPKETRIQYMLVIGTSEKNYLIRDPYLGISEISSDDLIYSWTKNGGWMLTIIPTEKSLQKETPKSLQTKLL